MKLISIFLSTALSVCLSKASATVVKLPLGLVEGYIKETLTGRKLVAFEGVPYARPPVGEFRFKPASPPEPWIGVWKAVTKYKCLQYDHFTPPGANMVSGDEDCLYLNIYTPYVNPKRKLNVLVFIHGGAFMFNHGGLYGPEILLDKDIVYVNINYRLGPLGFLSTEDDEVPGNNGLRDQILALKWIKENIENFGGNPNSITIFGMSAGGASVEFHYLFPESTGLFHKGISQSGVVLNPWVLLEKPLEKTKKLSNVVGCPEDNNKIMVQCLLTKPARQIVEAVKHFQPFLYNPFSPFAPVVDSWAKDPLLPNHPYHMLIKKKVQDLPWLVSYVAGEGLYPGSEFYRDDHLEYIDRNWNTVLPYILHYNDVIPENLFNSVSQKIRDEYMQGKKLTKETFHLLIKAISDRLFIDDIEKAARLHNNAVSSPVYSYHFAYRGVHSKTELRLGTNENIGVSHADDTAYVLYVGMDTLSTNDDREMTRIMVDMITSFMESGKPNATVEWQPLPKGKLAPWLQLHISNPKKIYMEEINGNLGNRAFWKSLGFEENENLVQIHDEL